jgi:hypothetical protein
MLFYICVPESVSDCCVWRRFDSVVICFLWDVYKYVVIHIKIRLQFLKR